jgi:hypothetical protein
MFQKDVVLPGVNQDKNNYSKTPQFSKKARKECQSKQMATLDFV